MGVIVNIAIIIWLIYLIIKHKKRSQDKTGNAPRRAARFYEHVFAAALLITLLTVLNVMLFWGGAKTLGVYADADFWSAPGVREFLLPVVITAALLLFALVLVLLAVLHFRASAPATGAGATAGAGSVETPAGVRLLGLFAFLLAIFLLGWLYLPSEQEYRLMLNVVYPASIAVGVVLLFDKATRAWNPKGGWETAREWFYCDAILILLVLGFVNLMQLSEVSQYQTLVWDLLFIVLFFFIFWLVDRKLARSRFLVAQIYLLLMPLMLLIWTAANSATPVETLTGNTMFWLLMVLPFIAFLMEIIALVASAGAGNSAVPAIKDMLFFVLYAIFFIIAIPVAVEVTTG